MNISKDVFTAVLPNQLRKSVSDELLDSINNHLVNSERREMFRDNLIGFSRVLRDGKYKLEDYVNAVKYVTFKMMGDSNKVSYIKTFPDRFQRLVDEGLNEKEISSYVAAYNKNKLVVAVYEQTLVPVHILNMDLRQKAINVMADIMLDEDVSPKVRSDTAYNLATTLAPPADNKINLEVNIGEDSAIAALRESTMALVAQQREMLVNGFVTADTVAKSGLIIEGEVNE